MKTYLFVAIAYITQHVTNGHSWVACTQYETNDTNYLTMGNFDRSKCRGYPRNYRAQLVAEIERGWAAETGYDWRKLECRDSFASADYSDSIPMAYYYSNEVIHISHPAKSHVADECTIAFIPSTSMKLMMSSKPMADTFDLEVPMVGPEHTYGVIDHRGFQNCYKYCENQDKSHCLTTWTLPTITESGRYSFKWVWEFNPNDLYVSCFDAFVLSRNETVPPPKNVTYNSTVPVITTPMPTTTVAPRTTTPIPTTTVAPMTTTPMPTTSIPTVAPTVAPTSIPTVAPTATSNLRPIITSDASQLASIISQIIESAKITFSGIVNITFTP